MNLQRKSVHKARKFDLFVVKAAYEFAKLLLRRDDDPVLTAAFDAEALHNSLKIEHLLYVASDELADLVDNKHQCLTGSPALHQFIRTLSQLCRRDVSLVLDSLHP